MTTLNTVSVTTVEDSVTSINDSNLDEDEILSSSRIKQRRATVTPSALPTTQLPRYLRDPGRYGNNRSRRQSMPVQYLNHGPSPRALPSLPSIQLADDKDENQEQIDKSSEVGTKYARTLLKNPVKECRSFPLDNRLQLQGQDWNRFGNGSKRKIDNSSEKEVLSHLNPGFSIPKLVGSHNDARTENEIEFIGFRSQTPNFLNLDTMTLSPSPKSDKHRRHSIAVSVITDSQRLRGDSPLPGMTDLGKSERSLCKSRDRTISVPGADADLEAGRNPGERKMSRYVPKPDNHMLLSLFSCICCCPLVGLVALIFSIQVDLKYEKGKKEDSIVKSKNARCWAISAVAIGMMLILGGSMYAVIVFAVPNRGSK